MLKICEVCNNSKLKKVLDLGRHPLCDDLVPLHSKKKNKFYKIQILFCPKCFTAHQKYQVKKKILFPKKYHYRARFTQDVINGMKDLVNDTKKFKSNLKNKTVLDIGCNDGTLLNFFKKEGCNTIGVEPTDASKDTKKNHLVINSYFDYRAVKKIKKFVRNIDIITFTNVFAHIENLKNLIRNLKKILSKNTIVVIENHYLGSVLEKNQFDTFYHEHPRTYSLSSFDYISKSLGLKITKVKFPKRYGGNIRVFLGNQKLLKQDIKKIKNKEKKFSIQFLKLSKKIENWKSKKKKLIKKIFLKHGKLDAKAFPGRAAILVRLLSLDGYISSVYEKKHSMKINHYIPGTRIPIKSDEFLIKKIDKIKILLNFAWHISKEIKIYLKNLGYKGRIIDIIEKKDFG